MRSIAGPGHVSNEFIDYDPTTNPNGTVVTADWANDVQDEILGIQGGMSIAEAAGTNEYVLASIIGMSKRYAFELGEMRMIPGEVKAPVAFDKDAPTTFFPALCATDIAKGTAKTISTTNWPDLVPVLRTRRLRYLDQQTGDTVTFSGTVSGSVLTLDSNTANDDLLAMLVEYQADYGTYTDWLSGDVDGTTHEITAVDAVARTITFGTAPTTGVQNLTIYPHRITGSTTTARVHSLAGKAFVGAGTTEIMSMGMRRDHGQQITGVIRFSRFDDNFGLINSESGVFTNSTGGTTHSIRDRNSTLARGTDNAQFDSADSTDSRVDATTTHPADYAGHFYYHGGTYTA